MTIEKYFYVLAFVRINVKKCVPVHDYVEHYKWNIIDQNFGMWIILKIAPKKDLHSRKWVVQSTWLLNAKESLTIKVNFPLIGPVK